jgi:hypothetical protein
MPWGKWDKRGGRIICESSKPGERGAARRESPRAAVAVAPLG